MNPDVAQYDIVLSTAGRDAGKHMMVIALDGGFAKLADGRMRKVERPKKKKIKHIRFIAHCEGRILDRALRDGRLSNSEVRKAIKAVETPPTTGENV